MTSALVKLFCSTLCVYGRRKPVLAFCSNYHEIEHARPFLNKELRKDVCDMLSKDSSTTLGGVENKRCGDS